MPPQVQEDVLKQARAWFQLPVRAALLGEWVQMRMSLPAMRTGVMLDACTVCRAAEVRAQYRANTAMHSRVPVQSLSLTPLCPNV